MTPNLLTEFMTANFLMRMIPALSTLLTLFIALPGCSQETVFVEDFYAPQSSTLIFEADVSVAYSNSGLYFSLSEIPPTKNNRDFSDYLSVELLDDKGQVFSPEKIVDINGQRRDIVAFYSNIPKGTHIKQVMVKALKPLKGNRIRWWSGQLK